MNTRKIILLIAALLIFKNSIAQKAIFCKPAKNKNALQLKWFNADYDLKAQYNLYRQQQGSSEWLKINPTPLLSANATIANGTDVDKYKQFVKTIAGKDSLAIAFEKYFMLMRIMQSNALAQMMNMFFEDDKVVAGKTYSYQLKTINGNTESEFAVSAPTIVQGKNNIPPPSNLSATVADNNIQLNWQPDSSAMLYHIFRATDSDLKNAALVKIVLNPMWDSKRQNEKYLFVDNDSALNAGTNYNYRIMASDVFADNSDFSNSASIFYAAKKNQNFISDFTARENKKEVILTWKLNTKADAKGINIYKSFSRDKDFKAITTKQLPVNTTTFTDKEITEGQKAFYFAEIIFENKTISKSLTASAAMPDYTPPTVPVNLKAETSVGKISLAWNKNSEGDMLGYFIFRGLKNETGNFNLLNTIPVSENSYIDSLPKEAANLFAYKICAVDKNYNRSEPSNLVFAKMPDVLPPSAPSIKRLISTDDGVLIIWNKLNDAGIKGFELVRKEEQNSKTENKNSELVFTNIPAKDTALIDVKATDGKTYFYTLSCIDSAGNKSTSTAVRINYISTAKPKTPSQIKAMFDEPKQDIKITWEKTVQPKSFAGYIVFRKEEGRNFVPVSPMLLNNEFADTKIETGKKYTYKINVLDSSGKMIVVETTTVVETKSSKN